MEKNIIRDTKLVQVIILFQIAAREGNFLKTISLVFPFDCILMYDANGFVIIPAYNKESNIYRLILGLRVFCW